VGGQGSFASGLESEQELRRTESRLEKIRFGWMDVAWFESPWTIAAVTIVLTYLAAPLFDWGISWLRSRWGPLTGAYLAITNQDGALVVERATCWQVGNSLRGRIDAVLTAQPVSGQVHDHHRIAGARYSLEGRRISDVLVLTYWDSSQSRAAGTLSLRALPSREQILLGGWAGAVGFDVARARCIWIRVKRRDFPLGDIDAFLVAVNCALKVVEPLSLLGYTGPELGPRMPMLKGAEPDYPSLISACIRDTTNGYGYEW
jgi:hypothetical protein